MYLTLNLLTYKFTESILIGYIAVNEHDNKNRYNGNRRNCVY
jgi:hypothetical protein